MQPAKSSFRVCGSTPSIAARLTGLSGAEQIEIELPARTDTAAFAVGDWVLADPLTRVLHRRLERRTLLQRAGEGKRPAQLVAANVDTLFIAASCNADFNLARLERYLAFANDAGTTPVIVLTKADMADDAQNFASQAADCSGTSLSYPSTPARPMPQ